jgi:hypothetical protein
MYHYSEDKGIAARKIRAVHDSKIGSRALRRWGGQAELARMLDVSRQYVHYVLATLDAEGTANENEAQHGN